MSKRPLPRIGIRKLSDRKRPKPAGPVPASSPVFPERGVTVHRTTHPDIARNLALAVFLIHAPRTHCCPTGDLTVAAASASSFGALALALASRKPRRFHDP